MADIVLTKVKGGSTAVFWSNDSLPFSPCPNDQLKRLKDIVFYSDSSIRDDVVQRMAEADFILHKVWKRDGLYTWANNSELPILCSMIAMLRGRQVLGCGRCGRPLGESKKN